MPNVEPQSDYRRLKNMSFFKPLASWRLRSLVIAGVALVGVPSACSSRTGVEIQEVRLENEGATLVFQVNTCNEDSTELSIVESDDEIIATATTRTGYGCGARDDCSDPRTVELDAPLGDRRVVDGDGNEIRRPEG